MVSSPLRQRHSAQPFFLDLWLAQPDWPSAAATQAMRAILANDGDQLAAVLPQVNLQDLPPVAALSDEEASVETAPELRMTEGTPWLSYAAAGADRAVAASLASGADPVANDPNEEGYSPLFRAFNDGHPLVMAAFLQADFPLDATTPAQPDGYGPLAALLCHITSKPLTLDETSPLLQPRREAVQTLLDRGGTFTPDTRLAVLRGAVSMATPDLLPPLESIGCSMADLAQEAQSSLLSQALTVEHIYARGHDWMAWFAARQTPVAPQDLQRQHDPSHARVLQTYSEMLTPNKITVKPARPRP